MPRLTVLETEGPNGAHSCPAGITGIQSPWPQSNLDHSAGTANKGIRCYVDSYLLQVGMRPANSLHTGWRTGDNSSGSNTNLVHIQIGEMEEEKGFVSRYQSLKQSVPPLQLLMLIDCLKTDMVRFQSNLQPQESRKHLEHGK